MEKERKKEKKRKKRKERKEKKEKKRKKRKEKRKWPWWHRDKELVQRRKGREGKGRRFGESVLVEDRVLGASKLFYSIELSDNVVETLKETSKVRAREKKIITSPSMVGQGIEAQYEEKWYLATIKGITMEEQRRFSSSFSSLSSFRLWPKRKEKKRKTQRSAKGKRKTKKPESKTWRFFSSPKQKGVWGTRTQGKGEQAFSGSRCPCWNHGENREKYISLSLKASNAPMLKQEPGSRKAWPAHRGQSNNPLQLVSRPHFDFRAARLAGNQRFRNKGDPVSCQLPSSWEGKLLLHREEEGSGSTVSFPSMPWLFPSPLFVFFFVFAFV